MNKKFFYQFNKKPNQNFSEEDFLSPVILLRLPRASAD